MKLKPKAFTEEQLNKIKSEAATQVVSKITPKSTDPENFPVFDIPVNGKVLVYVPNHTILNPETGKEELRMDKPWIHTIVDGKRFIKARCIKGLSSDVGYTGDCPLCEGESEPWDLANEQIKELCSTRGLDPNDAENDAVKAIKTQCYSSRVVKEPSLYYTFPIVVIETDKENIKEIIMDDNGIPKHKVYWYSISKKAYDNKWAKTLEGMEDEPTHPGGNCFILNYTYESKSGDYNKRDSAKNLSVVAKRIKGFENIAPIFDDETAEWDTLKAMTTIYDNMYYDESDLKGLADKALQGTREKLAIYAASKTMGKLPSGDENSGFQLGSKPVNADDDDIGSLPLVGETDLG